MYWNEVPAEDGGLVKRCLQARAFRFNHEAIKIDEAVFNPARIWKLYGTVARKGDPAADRPHRLARGLAVSIGSAAVPKDPLAGLARGFPDEPKTPSRRKGDGGSGSFILDEWISRHSLDLIGSTAWKGGRGVGPVCPWSPDHSRSAYIVPR